MNNELESVIIDFVGKLKVRQTEEVMRILASTISELTALAGAVTKIHRHATASGANIADLKDILRERGVSEESIKKMMAEARAAQDAFADERAQAALGSMLEHFSDALEIAERLLRDPSA